MKILLLYPRFPKSFWSFEKALALIDRKAALPPLGLVTVAAILPQTWEFKLVDRNVRECTEAEWDWADVVILSAMIVQKEDLRAQITEAKRRGKSVAVGGTYPTSLPDELTVSGADYLILDEGEITLPLFVDAIARGERTGIFRAGNEKPDVTHTPIPRFDLLELDAYEKMSVQFSRGCPFQCEFCDIIVLYGRKPRTKTPTQLLAELECLYQLGWRRGIFMVDDNFIGNKRNVKLLLQELLPWMQAHRYPFPFSTEASVDLAEDRELMDLMVACNFEAVFLGIETPDQESLTLTKKHQNTRNSLSEAVQTITRSGLRVQAGFIIGFDGEKTGAGARIVQFVSQTAIPIVFFSLLKALPNTPLWYRLEKEGRLRKSTNTNQSSLMNFIPTRPMQDLGREFVEAFWDLYEPEQFLDRVYRHYRLLGEATYPNKVTGAKKPSNWKLLRGLAIVCWRQGVQRQTRFAFWRNLWEIYRHFPKGLISYLSVCALLEHFYEYRQIVRDEIESQLTDFLEAEAMLQVNSAFTPSQQ